MFCISQLCKYPKTFNVKRKTKETTTCFLLEESKLFLDLVEMSIINLVWEKMGVCLL